VSARLRTVGVYATFNAKQFQVKTVERTGDMNNLITVLLPFVCMSAAFVFTTTSSSVVQAAGCETASFGEAASVAIKVHRRCGDPPSHWCSNGNLTTVSIERKGRGPYRRASETEMQQRPPTRRGSREETKGKAEP